MVNHRRPGHICTVEPQLSESPLSEPSVIRTQSLILKSQKQFDFLQNQVINEMSV